MNGTIYSDESAKSQFLPENLFIRSFAFKVFSNDVSLFVSVVKMDEEKFLL